MVINKEELQKTYQFTYTSKLVFSDPLIEHNLKLSCSEQKVPEEALVYGNRYHQELLLGTEAYSDLKWINQEVGYGLYAQTDLAQGTFIGEYTGLVCHNNPYYKMSNYCFNYPIVKSKNTLSIDAEPYGNLTRFINHSFHPNLDILHAFHSDLYHVILVANQLIKKGNHLTYNYGHSYWYLRGTPHLFF